MSSAASRHSFYARRVPWTPRIPHTHTKVTFRFLSHRPRQAWWSLKDPVSLVSQTFADATLTSNMTPDTDTDADVVFEYHEHLQMSRNKYHWVVCILRGSPKNRRDAYTEKKLLRVCEHALSPTKWFTEGFRESLRVSCCTAHIVALRGAHRGVLVGVESGGNPSHFASHRRAA